MQQITYITEQCGARWVVYRTGVGGGRAYEVRLVRGVSAAKAHVFAFYADSIDAACNALNN